MTVKLLTEHHLEFLSLKGGCTGSSESTLVKMPHCWKSHVTAQLVFQGNIHKNRFVPNFIFFSFFLILFIKMYVTGIIMHAFPSGYLTGKQ